MRKLLWIAPALLLLGGCSNDGPPVTYAAPPASRGPAGTAAAVVEASSPFTPDPPARVPAVISSGTSLHVRVDDAIDTRRNRAGDRFEATLVRPVIVDGRTVLPAGTPFRGRVTTAAASGRWKGRAVLGLSLDGFRLHGREYPIATAHVSRVSSAHENRNTALIGGGAALGTAPTGKKEVVVAAETPLVFVVRSAVRL